MSEYAIEFKGVTKRFDSLVVNNNISWSIERGEVHALLGENGAGKSTITSILFGLIEADSGTIWIEGKLACVKNPNDANMLGIGMVHQHFKLVPSYTVLENIILGVEPKTKLGHINYDLARRKIRDLSQQFGLEVDPDARVRTVSVAMQQRVEILKTLYREAKIIIFDEPTAVLTPLEIDELMHIIDRLKSQGCTIIFISHKLNEIKRCSDRVTVLRRGKIIGTVVTAKATEAELAQMMVGHAVSFTTPKKLSTPGKVILDIKNLVVKSSNNRTLVDDLSLIVRAGEVVGIAGVDGNGQSEIALAIIGIIKPFSGNIYLSDKEITYKSVRKRIESGLGFTPENRETQAVVGEFNLVENYLLKTFYKKPYSNYFGWLDKKYMEQEAEVHLEAFDVRSAKGLHSSINELSGGNRQKVILAREISLASQLLVVCQPTRGLDVGSIEYIHKRIIQQRDSGKAVLLISFELDEILNLCDRIVAVSRGQIMGSVEAKDATKQTIGQMMVSTK